MLRKDGLVLGLQDQLAGLLDTEREEATACLAKDKQLSLQERALDSLQNMTALQARRGGARDTALRILQYTVYQATFTYMEQMVPAPALAFRRDTGDTPVNKTHMVLPANKIYSCIFDSRC